MDDEEPNVIVVAMEYARYGSMRERLNLHKAKHAWKPWATAEIEDEKEFLIHVRVFTNYYVPINWFRKDHNPILCPSSFVLLQELNKKTRRIMSKLVPEKVDSLVRPSFFSKLW